MDDLTGEELHERIIAHLEAQKALTNRPVYRVNGVISYQGAKPALLIKCPNCVNVFGMSGHAAGEVLCNICGVLCQVTPVEAPLQYRR